MSAIARVTTIWRQLPTLKCWLCGAKRCTNPECAEQRMEAEAW